jgi:diguanylate cyclase (GGDEF)-like protein
MASWPQPSDRRGRTPRSSAVRRRVDATLARAMRQAMLIGGPLLIVLVAADAAEDLLRIGNEARPGAVIAVVEMLGVMGGLVAVRRGARTEPIALALLLMIATVLVLERGTASSSSDVSLAYLSTLLVASGLFLPWRPTWHAGWVAAALLVAVIGSRGALSGPVMGVNQLVVVAMAALASVVGQELSYLRLRRGLEQQFELRALSQSSQRQEQLVTELNRELVETARVDAVTGLGNRRGLDEALASLAGRRLAAILLDLDHFKNFNDRSGHLAGDAALARIGELLRDTVRAGDLAFRYGGEEFLVLIPGGDIDGAAQLAERIRVTVRDDLATGGDGLTISAGVAAADRFSSSDPLPLLRRADQALYQAKRDGRDRVVVGDEVAQRARMRAAG